MQIVCERVLDLVGNVIRVRAPGVAYEELAEVQTLTGTSLAQVIKIDGEIVSLQVFTGTRGVSTNAEVRFTGNPMRVAFSDKLFGRAFSGSGSPLDEGTILTDNLMKVGGPSVNPVKRRMPNRMIRTGIPMIDLYNTLVRSQKIPIFSIPGEPYNELLARIAAQAEADVVVLGGMGLTFGEYMFFKRAIAESGAADRSVLFVHQASDPTVECLMVPDLALTVAQKFAQDGKDVLVLLNNMTSFADAMKEIAIGMDQVPSNRGYPGDLYSQLASRYERAVEFEGAGSVTILAVTTMPGDDVTHPVPDNTGYITEGQYYLRGGRIEPFGSLSRLKQLVNGKTRADHRALMEATIRLYASYKEVVEKQAMGFQMSEWDKKLIAYGVAFEAGMMDLKVNIPLEDALDRGWRILADCFDPEETGIRSTLIREFWPQKA
jgi:V/A-type H+-transporting ATPase subunit B